MTNHARKPTTKLSAGLTALSLNIATPEQTEMPISATSALTSQNGLLMSVPVHEINFFDKNPRQYHDSENYQHIKESIRSLGVLQPVHITQRPNETHYILAQGGNTRLKIMRELFEETGDERFRLMPCLYQPYRDDTVLQIAHLIENEQRAEMCFWDKARAYAEIRALLLDDNTQQSSLRHMEHLFSAKGLSVSHTVLSLFFFAHDHLQALGELGFGLSHAKVSELKKCHARLFQAAKSAQKSEAFADFWQTHLQQFQQQVTDPVVWEISPLLSFLENEFSQQFEIKLPESTTVPVKKQHETVPVSNTPTSEQTIHQTTQDDDVSVPPVTVEQGFDTLAQPKTSTPIEMEQSTEQVKAQLQKKLHSAVRRVLNAVGLQSCFVANDRFHYGFFIDYPAFEHFTSNGQCVFAIDALNPDAGDVFVYVSKLSRQNEWLLNADKSANNPISTLPESSKLRIACYDAEKLEEYNEMGIGSRSMLPEKMIAWHTDPNHELHGFIIDLSNLILEINKINSSKG